MYLVESPEAGHLVHSRGEAAGTAFRIASYAGSATVWSATWGKEKLAVCRGESASAIQGRITMLDAKHTEPPPDEPPPDGPPPGEDLPIEVERAA